MNYIFAWCMEAHKYSKDQHEKRWCQDAMVSYELYRNFVRPGLDPDSLSPLGISLGLAFPLVKIMSARLAAPWQAGDRLIECQPNDGFSSAKAPLIASYVNDMIVNQMPRMFSKLELVKESTVALGRGVLKPIVRKRPSRTVLKRKPIMLPIPLPGYPAGMQLGSYLGWEREPATSQMTAEYVDPFQFWFMGSDRWADGAEQTFEEAYLTPTEVALRVESGEFNQKFDYFPEYAMGYDQWAEKRRSMEFGYGDTIRSGSGGGQQKMHRYLEIQGLIETRRRQNGFPVYEQLIVGILDERQIVKYDRLGTWDGTPDYIVWELFQDVAGDRPMGLIEPCTQVLNTIDEFMTIALDNSRKILESPLAVDPTMTDQNDIYIGSGAVNWIRNPGNSIKPIEMKDLPRSFYDLTVQLNEILYRITGMSDLIGGVATGNTSQGADTARGMGLLASMATSRLAPLLTKMDMELYRPFAKWIHQTGKQRMDEEQYVRVASSSGAQFQRIGPDALDADVGFSFNAKALDAASGSRRQEFIQMFTLLVNPAMTQQLMGQGYYLDAYESARLLMTEFDRPLDLPTLVKRVTQGPALPQATPGGPFAMPGQGSLPGAVAPPQDMAQVPPEGNALPPLPAAA